ncbi:MAG: sodium:proton antiporter, partial [Desulfobulbaceae bacterium]
MKLILRLVGIAAASLFGLQGAAIAAESAETVILLTNHWIGYTALVIFVVAYALVMAEEFTHLRKSKPVLLAAGIIWGMIAYMYVSNGLTHAAE